MPDVIGNFEGAYLNRPFGKPAYSGVFTGDVLSPFHPLNAYLWVGAAAAFALAAIALFVVARLGRRG